MSSTLNNVLEEGQPTEENLSFFELAQSTEDAPNKKKEKDIEPTEEELEFFELQSPYQEEPVREDVGYWQSMMNAVPRGLIEGVEKLGRTMGPLGDTEEYKYEPEKIAAYLDELFPADDEFMSNVIKKTGQVLPMALSTPTPGVPGGGSPQSTAKALKEAAPTLLNTGTRAVTGSALSESAKELGLPEWAQTIADIAPWLAPNLAAVNKAGSSIGGILSKLEESAPKWAKKLVSKFGPKSIKEPLQELIESGAAREKVLEFARAAGMSEKEIAPLLQGGTKKKWLAKLASKGESTGEKLGKTKSAIGRVYDSIGELPGANQTYTTGQKTRLIKNLQDQFEKMPASVKKVIQEDFQTLIDGPIDGKKVMKFFSDVNHELGPKTKQLSLLKDPIKKSLMEVDSTMGHMFDATNNLKSKYHSIANRLRPGIADALISEGKSQGALWGVLSGDVGLISKIAKLSGAKKVAEFMLTSPRWQNLSGKMVSALNSGKFVVAEHVKKQMIDEIKDVDPRIAQALEELNIEAALGDK